MNRIKAIAKLAKHTKSMKEILKAIEDVKSRNGNTLYYTGEFDGSMAIHLEDLGYTIEYDYAFDAIIISW